MLYTRYRVARVMSVITVGDVYHADAIDRRGYRVRFIVDGDNGAVLDSFMVGRSAYEAPVPIPPGLVPNGPGARLAPFGPQPDRLAPPEPARPVPRRQARTPEPETSASEPGKAKTAPALRAPTAPAKQEPAPLTAARPPEKSDEVPAVKPIIAPPPPSAAPAAPRPPSEARQTTPAGRTPEPLIDPKTGQSNAAVPVTPLDDAKPVGSPTKPITIMPPATLD
jgi:hypothetical protein